MKYLRLHGLTKIEELEKHLGIDARQVRRYCQSLKEAGYPLCSKTGKNGGYYLDEPEIYPAEWEMLRELLPPDLYGKIEVRLLEEFAPGTYWGI